MKSSAPNPVLGSESGPQLLEDANFFEESWVFVGAAIVLLITLAYMMYAPPGPMFSSFRKPKFVGWMTRTSCSRLTELSSVPCWYGPAGSDAVTVSPRPQAQLANPEKTMQETPSTTAVRNAVDTLCFGRAQVQVLALAFGIWFVENLQISVAVVSDSARAKDLGLGEMEQALLTSMIFIGIMLGSCLGGFMGDSLGRRPPLLLSYFLASLAQVATAIVHDYRILCVLRVLIGIAHGVGMPASLAMVSESVPSPMRVMLGGVRHLQVAAGGIAASLLFCFDSPSLAHLHWSWESAMVALPPLAMGILALMLLPESPVFLASVGRHSEAQAVVHRMQHLNSRSDIAPAELWIIPPVACPAPAASPQLAVKPKSEDTGDAQLDLMSAICRSHSSMRLVTLIAGAATMNLLCLGHLFAFPHIATTVHSTLRAGYQSLLQNVMSFVMGLCVMNLTRFVSCRMILIASSVIGIVGLAVFVWTGSMPVRSSWAEFLYLVSQNTPLMASAMGIMGIYQLAVDLFPVRARVVSAGVCIAAGRVTAITAPFIFEAFARWQHFYLLMVGLCFITLNMAVLHLPKGGDQDIPLSSFSEA